MRKRLLWIAPLALVGIVVFAGLGGLVVRALWNWLLPPMFGWPMITFWQALALLALCRILFGRLGPNGSNGWRMRRRWAERWDRMTPEERQRFRQGVRGHWMFGGGGEPKPEGPGA
jgi:hypothetical protein